MKKIGLCTILLFLVFNIINQERALGLERPLVPGPLFTFGQNIVPAGFAFGNWGLEYFKSKNGFLWLTFLEVLYGIRDDLSFSVGVPIVLKEKVEVTDTLTVRSQGLGSLIVQAEYAFYTKNDVAFQYQATVLGSVFLPTATTKILLAVANKKTDFFIGTTHSLFGNRWYAYNAYGGLIPTSKHDKVGSRLRYDLGFGCVLSRWPRYLALLLEMSGLYAPRNEHSQIGIRRASNIIYLGPSLRWISTFLVQAGFQYPIAQTGFEIREHHGIHFACSIAWKF